MRISERGQITIPKVLRDQMGLYSTVEVEISATDDGLLIKKRAGTDHPVDRVAGILNDAGFDIDTDFDIDEYIEEIRGR